MTAPAQRRGLVGLLAAVGISTAGTRMSLLALPWFVLSTTGSPTLTGLVATMELAPYVTVQAVGGPAVDRLGAWRTSVWCDVGAGLLIGLIPVLHVLSLLTTPQMLGIVAVAGALRGAGDAGREVMLPGVGEHAGTPLERSAGLLDGVSRTAGLIGAPLAGVLIGLTSAVNVLAIDAGSFVVSAVFVAAFVPRSAQPATPQQDDAPLGYAASLREGFAFLRGDRLLLGIGAMVLITNLLDQASSAVLTPVWAREVAHSAVALGLISGAFGLGAVAGNVFTTWLGPRLPRRWTYAIGFLMTGGPRMLTLALATSVSPVLAVCVIAGFGAGGINPILGAVQYRRIPRHLQVRVMGAVNAAAWAGMPVGGLLAGALVEAVGLRPTLAAGAAVYFATTLAPFVFPAWRAMDEPAERDEELVTSAAR
jgi:Na+/melibiose symporter-like transporter